ncbi:nicotinate-nucleotide diphosphorylase (carboxylating) [bacterium (Candidatus Blackallbacteria) CG17_big_fil_post_rev_8_21_14_2_50_48_46]|uniref:Probable nicotinate-nucleotide pyrophosphorylase [carboxylating] n=1 Tax=bacterium (Candidatus Blackallbacteria) CG17_big_fil_post_rev_8_21_14_2_50_48_46 TaxID=2014261 RepID=A0A2M7FZX1_9BACT|nr:MAG: nicotinate-nucleotide diphosphorylase (carboxylating) [bacterium (Candidatus Blackallbacteria) CG18_big_fil_WC_8_21_14_2_50_49_26]PIW14983.1 MAG: nicotinate-nucleotide diphosphorylase (carboxylating) [bacterium (Candidatus Blackallbacteria) CG17_big_fil_post_rev_8_21_14_2_50_48_46]PIW50064.1 MAG: nicotinate-nucleotide diphosphorylase (carboxylating) [bacterium (Candidatus Blackallbacteria) CG13_big_fil_rev_8_21_14_2_50_49_14]
MTLPAYDLTQTPELWFIRTLELDPAYVNQRIAWFFAEDMPQGDITVLSTIDPESQSVAHVLAAQDLVFAGSQVLPHIFSEDVEVKLMQADGEAVKAGTVLAELKGPSQELLMRERVMLNLLQRLCGIATLTRKHVSLEAPVGFKILDTRKTTPGLRLFEKYAVAVGGGYNHRRDLSSVAMLKDNHLVAAGGVKAALESVIAADPEVYIELEVDRLDQLREALEVGGMHAILLDNMPPEMISEAVALVRNHPEHRDLFLEASGGITYATLPDYLWTGVNGISIGALTTQAQNVDIKLEFIA